MPPRDMVFADIIKRQLYQARAENAMQQCNSISELIQPSRSIIMALEHNVIANDTENMQIFKDLEAFHINMLRCLEYNGHERFYPVQLHAINASLRSMFVGRYGFKRMNTVCALFDDELDRLGYQMHRVFLPDEDEGLQIDTRQKEWELNIVMKSMIWPDESPGENGAGSDGSPPLKQPKKRLPTWASAMRRVSAVQTSRQYGKSLVMHCLVACAMCIWPGTAILLLANGQNLNVQNRRAILDLLEDVMGERLLVSNMHEVKCVNGSELLSRSSQSIRGVRPDIVSIDEASFIKRDVYTRGVAPLLNIEARCIIMFTTPNGSNRAWVNLLKSVDHINVVRVEEICRQCREASRKECMCNQHFAPDTRVNPETRGIIDVFYSMDPEARLEEIAGVTVEPECNALNNMDIDRLLNSRVNRPHEMLTALNNTIVFVYDPSGHAVSGAAFIALAIDSRTEETVIVGLDYRKEFDVNRVNTIARAFVDNLALRFKNHRMLTCLEANISDGLCNSIAGALEAQCHHHNWTCDHVKYQLRKGDVRIGVLTTNKIKVHGYMALHMLLSNQRIRMHRVLSCGSVHVYPTMKNKDYAIEELVQEFKLQLNNLVVSSRENGVHLIGGKNSGNDDLAIALILGVHTLHVSQQYRIITSPTAITG